MKQIWTSLKRIHLAICASIAMLVAVVYLVLQPDRTPTNSSEALSQEFILPILAIAAIGIGYFFFKRKLSRLHKLIGLESKIEGYRAANIIRWGVTEMAAFIMLIGFSTSGRNNLLLYALMIGVFLIYLRPLKSRLISELKLTDDEAELINAF